MKKLLTLITVILMMTGCGHRDSNQFDTNAAEMNESAGDVGRGNSETNAQAEQRVHGGGTVASRGTEKLNADNSFAAAAAEASLTEVSLGELAMTKNKNKELLDFAQMMIKDHSAANEELKHLAEQKGIKLPTECTTCQGTYHELHDLVGPEFEKRYSNFMVTDHEKAVELFEQESEHGKDPELKAWAKEQLPALRHHLEMAKSLAAENPGQNESPAASKKAAPASTEKSTDKEDAPKTKKEQRKAKREARKAKSSKG